jgi:SHS2 domain-containing protein
MKFEYVDITTADVCFVAYGKDLNECFANSALAMFEVMVNTKQILPRVERKVEVSAQDLQALLFEWLNELLFYYGSENLAFSKFSVEVDEKKFKVHATCWGETIDPERHETRTEVKACTMHKIKVEKIKDKWKAQVILDI